MFIKTENLILAKLVFTLKVMWKKTLMLYSCLIVLIHNENESTRMLHLKVNPSEHVNPIHLV